MLLPVRDAHGVGKKSTAMYDKKMFKVICNIEHANGRGSHWMRLGTGFENKDKSINVILDAIPVGQKEVQLQIRELDEEDLKKRELYTKPSAAPLANHASETLPF